MPAASASTQRTWRIHPQAIDLYLVLLKPKIVFRAQVNMASPTYPVASITYDTVTIGSYTAIKPGMTLRVGSANKKRDYGTTYVRAAATGTEIPIGWSSRGRARPGEVDLVDNAIIEVLDMREVWMEAPRILNDGTIYKKYDIPFTANSPPVANIGIDVASFAIGDSLRVNFNDAATFTAPNDFPSFATAPGADLLTWSWDFGDGIVEWEGTTTSNYRNVGNVAFPIGARYISLTVSDTNSQSHTAYCLIAVCATSGPNAPITNFQILEHSRRIEGSTLRFRVWDEMNIEDYPPGTRVLVFAKPRIGSFRALTGTRNNSNVITDIDTSQLYYGMKVTGDGVQFDTTIGNIDSPTQLTLTRAVSGVGTGAFNFQPAARQLTGLDRGSPFEQMLFSGWLTEEDHALTFESDGLRRNLTFTAIDAAGRLAQLHGFPFEISRKSTPTKWHEMKGANIARYVHYLLHWHSNVLSLVDFKWAGTDYDFARLASDGASLYEQANQRAEAMAARLGSDMYGRLIMAFDPMLQMPEDRISTEQVAIRDTDWRSLRWKFTLPPRVHWLRGAALLVSTADADVDNPYPVFAKSPGDAPGQGLSDFDQNYQLVKRTSDLWNREGQRYAARLNAQNGMYEIALAHGLDIGIDPARMEWVRLYIADANRSLRGVAYPDGVRMLVSEVSFAYDHAAGTVTQTITAEEEVVGTPGIYVATGGG